MESDTVSPKASGGNPLTKTVDRAVNRTSVLAPSASPASVTESRPISACGQRPRHQRTLRSATSSLRLSNQANAATGSRMSQSTPSSSWRERRVSKSPIGLNKRPKPSGNPAQNEAFRVQYHTYPHPPPGYPIAYPVSENPPDKRFYRAPFPDPSDPPIPGTDCPAHVLIDNPMHLSLKYRILERHKCDSEQLTRNKNEAERERVATTLYQPSQRSPEGAVERPPGSSGVTKRRGRPRKRVHSSRTGGQLSQKSAVKPPVRCPPPGDTPTTPVTPALSPSSSEPTNLGPFSMESPQGRHVLPQPLQGVDGAQPAHETATPEARCVPDLQPSRDSQTASSSAIKPSPDTKTMPLSDESSTHKPSIEQGRDTPEAVDSAPCAGSPHESLDQNANPTHSLQVDSQASRSAHTSGTSSGIQRVPGHGVSVPAVPLVPVHLVESHPAAPALRRMASGANRWDVFQAAVRERESREKSTQPHASSTDTALRPQASSQSASGVSCENGRPQESPPGKQHLQSSASSQASPSSCPSLSLEDDSSSISVPANSHVPQTDRCAAGAISHDSDRDYNYVRTSNVDTASAEPDQESTSEPARVSERLEPPVVHEAGSHLQQYLERKQIEEDHILTVGTRVQKKKALKAKKMRDALLNGRVPEFYPLFAAARAAKTRTFSPAESRVESGAIVPAQQCARQSCALAENQLESRRLTDHAEAVQNRSGQRAQSQDADIMKPDAVQIPTPSHDHGRGPAGSASSMSRGPGFASVEPRAISEAHVSRPHRELFGRSRLRPSPAAVDPASGIQRTEGHGTPPRWGPPGSWKSSGRVDATGVVDTGAAVANGEAGVPLGQEQQMHCTESPQVQSPTGQRHSAIAPVPRKNSVYGTGTGWTEQRNNQLPREHVSAPQTSVCVNSLRHREETDTCTGDARTGNHRGAGSHTTLYQRTQNETGSFVRPTDAFSIDAKARTRMDEAIASGQTASQERRNLRAWLHDIPGCYMAELFKVVDLRAICSSPERETYEDLRQVLFENLEKLDCLTLHRIAVVVLGVYEFRGKWIDDSAQLPPIK